MKTHTVGIVVAVLWGGVSFGAAPGRHLSDDYRMTADGRPVDVLRVPMPERSAGCIRDRGAWHPYSYAPFEATGTVSVAVRSACLDLFRDIDVLHLSLNGSPATAYWANCAIYIQPSRGQLMSGIVFDDVRFHEVGPHDIFLNVKTMPITMGFSFPEAGFLKGLTLRNINLPDSEGGMCVNLSAHDTRHPIEGVRFENVTGYGPVTKSGPVSVQFVP